MTELVPALVQAQIPSLDSFSSSDILPLKDKLSKKAFTALSKKCVVVTADGTVEEAPKKKRKVVGPTALPSTVELQASDDALVVFINRAPVLQMWTTCVCKVLEMSDVTALCIASVLVRDMSERKKKLLGLSVDKGDDAAAASSSSGDDVQVLNVLGFDVKIPKDENDLNVMAAKSLKYMENAFGDDFLKFYSAMMAHASAVGKEVIGSYGGYEEYERFRPPTSAGTKGFGEKGRFLLKAIKGT